MPFSTERKYMATVVEDGNGVRTLFVKGAPEIVSGLCRTIAGGVSRESIDSSLKGFQAQAMRTLIPGDWPWGEGGRGWQAGLR